MITSAIIEAMRPYSIAVAPDSSCAKLFKIKDNVRALLTEMSVQLRLNERERTQIERGDLKLRLICRENVPYPSADCAARLRTSFERAGANRKNSQQRLRGPCPRFASLHPQRFTP